MTLSELLGCAREACALKVFEMRFIESASLRLCVIDDSVPSGFGAAAESQPGTDGNSSAASRSRAISGSWPPGGTVKTLDLSNNGRVGSIAGISGSSAKLSEGKPWQEGELPTPSRNVKHVSGLPWVYCERSNGASRRGRGRTYRLPTQVFSTSRHYPGPMVTSMHPQSPSDETVDRITIPVYESREVSTALPGRRCLAAGGSIDLPPFNMLGG